MESMLPVIRVQNLSKVYPVADKEPGLAGTLRHFFRRQYKLIEAVQQVSFEIEPGAVVGFWAPTVPARPLPSRCSRG